MIILASIVICFVRSKLKRLKLLGGEPFDCPKARAKGKSPAIYRLHNFLFLVPWVLSVMWPVASTRIVVPFDACDHVVHGIHARAIHKAHEMRSTHRLIC